MKKKMRKKCRAVDVPFWAAKYFSRPIEHLRCEYFQWQWFVWNVALLVSEDREGQVETNKTKLLLYSLYVSSVYRHATYHIYPHLPPSFSQAFDSSCSSVVFFFAAVTEHSGRDTKVVVIMFHAIKMRTRAFASHSIGQQHPSNGKTIKFWYTLTWLDDSFIASIFLSVSTNQFPSTCFVQFFFSLLSLCVSRLLCFSILRLHLSSVGCVHFTCIRL